MLSRARALVVLLVFFFASLATRCADAGELEVRAAPPRAGARALIERAPTRQPIGLTHPSSRHATLPQAVILSVRGCPAKVRHARARRGLDAHGAWMYVRCA